MNLKVFLSKQNLKKYAIGAIGMTALLMVPVVGDWLTSAIGTVREKISGK